MYGLNFELFKIKILIVSELTWPRQKFKLNIIYFNKLVYYSEPT